MKEKLSGKRSVKIKSYLMPVVTVILVTVQFFFPYEGWVILAAGFGGMWILGLIWATFLYLGMYLEREMRYGWIQVGDQIQERISIGNTSRLPALWVKITDHSRIPGYSASRVTSVHQQWETSWFTYGICHRRGIYILGPTSIQTGDPFGFFTVNVHYSETVTMIVVPPIVSLPKIEIAPGGRSGEGKSTTRGLDLTIVAGGVREYIPGDSMRWLHWPTTAKHNKPFVRLFDFTPASDWWILLDMDPSVQAGKGQESTEEVGVILAASLVNEGLKKGKRVGFISQGEELFWHQPDIGDIHLWSVLRSLAIVKPFGPSLPKVLEHIRSSLKERTSLIVITPNESSSWMNELGLILRKEIVPTVLILNPAAFGKAAESEPIQNSLMEMGIHFYNLEETLQAFEKAGTLDFTQPPDGQIQQQKDLSQEKKLSWRPLGR